jgi:hypothetical protein
MTSTKFSLKVFNLLSFSKLCFVIVRSSPDKKCNFLPPSRKRKGDLQARHKSPFYIIFRGRDWSSVSKRATDKQCAIQHVFSSVTLNTFQDGKKILTSIRLACANSRAILRDASTAQRDVVALTVNAEISLRFPNKYLASLSCYIA